MICLILHSSLWRDCVLPRCQHLTNLFKRWTLVRLQRNGLAQHITQRWSHTENCQHLWSSSCKKGGTVAGMLGTKEPFATPFKIASSDNSLAYTWPYRLISGTTKKKLTLVNSSRTVTAHAQTSLPLTYCPRKMVSGAEECTGKTDLVAFAFRRLTLL
jgi:hypothetical protein